METLRCTRAGIRGVAEGDAERLVVDDYQMATLTWGYLNEELISMEFIILL